MLRKQNNTARKHSVWETNLQPRTQTACFLLTCCRGPWVTVRTAQFGCRPKLNNMQHREHYMSSYMKGVLAAWSAATGRLHRRAGRGSGSEIHPLNARCVVLGAGAEATRTPDAFVLAATQSFSPQLSGFLSLLLLKRCFEIRLPFEVSQVQHDIYLRYTPNCFLSRSHPLSPETCFLHFRQAPHTSHARGAPKWCPPLPKKKKNRVRPITLSRPRPCVTGAGGTWAAAGHAATSAGWHPSPARGSRLMGRQRGEKALVCGGRLLTNPGRALTQPRRLSISPRLWQGPGARSNPCVQAGGPPSPVKYFIITTAVKYWWLLASPECFSWRLSLRVMEPNSSLCAVSDIWKSPKKSKGA